MAVDAAAEEGHLDVVKWLHNNRQEGVRQVQDRAAANGHLEVVKWLHLNRSEGCTTSAMDCAAFMQFDSKPSHCITSLCCTDKAPSSFVDNELAILEFLHSNRSEGCTVLAMDGAAAVGNWKVVQWLHAKTTAGCTSKAMDNAARMGRLDMVQRLHQNRSEGCTFKAMDTAAANGHLDVVKWLYANRSEGCPATALDAAAGFVHSSVTRHYNYLRVEQWIASHCDGLFPTSALARALLARNFEVALLLHAGQPTYCEAIRRKIQLALAMRCKQSSDSEILLTWFNENCPPRTESV